MTDEGYARPELLAETDWLAQSMDDPNLRIVDCSTVDGYRRAHISGAVGLPVLNWIKDPERETHVMPPQPFASLTQVLGIDEQSTVVVYDDTNGMVSTRLWWVLNYYGHTNTKVLNGGWQRWMAEGRSVSRERTKAPTGGFTPRPNESMIARLEDVMDKIGDPHTVLLDVRSSGEWLGKEALGNNRTGHLPGAVHHDWLLTTTADERRVFKPAGELRASFEAVGATRDKEIITYCQVGLRAAHQAFVLSLLGYERVRNYDASMLEWANRTDTPLVMED